MPPKFVKSKRGGKILVHNSYQYHKHSQKKERTYWVCARKPECNARAATISDPPEVVRESAHSHAPDQDEVAAKELMNEIKRSSIEQPEAPPIQITSNQLQRIPKVLLAKLPNDAAIKRTINRTRQSALPPNPKALTDLPLLPPVFTLTLMGDVFLLWDSLEEEDDDDDDDDEARERRRRNRILIFATKDNLRKLCASDCWLVDGTFKVSPSLFTQLFTIHGIFRGAAFPFAYALLPNKEQVSYHTVLEVVLDKCRKFRIPSPEPTTVVSDFEVGIINAVTAVFPDARLRLCFFHLGQSMYRHVQDEGLQVAYRDPLDRSIKEGVHQILSLAFVPPDDIPAVVHELRDELPDRLLAVMDYFDDVYVSGRRLRGQRRAARPRYAPELWNQHETALQGEPRTNNLSEGWHRRFNTLVGKDHPSVYALIKEIQKEQGNSERHMSDLELGKHVKAPQRLKYRMVTERLQRITARYHDMKAEGRAMDFLRACGNNLTL